MASIRTTKPAKRWEVVAPSDVSALASELELPPAIAGILIARGIRTVEAAQVFLHPSLNDLHDPLLLRDMPIAIDRLRRAIAAGERIEIHGDYDVDGTTSTVILKTAIGLAGGRADFWIPHRVKDGYGMRESAVDLAAERGVKLIISVDTGIRAAAAVNRARELGIDVIVTDHHLPDQTLPAALAVVNPNRLDCTYPEKNLCGAGVAFKLAQGLIETLGWPKDKRDRMLASFLKLAAIATVADVVPLTGENRIIVSHGLRGLAHTRNPGLRALLDAAGVPPGRAPNVGQVGFRIAPRINAAGRMASADEVMQLFAADGDEKARAIAERLTRLNTERQDEEARIIDEILLDCEGHLPAELPAAFVFAGEAWHRGVLGIVASRLAERFCRPTVVLGIENGEAAGSARSIRAFHLLESLESMRHLFVKFGGHRQAAGMTLETARVDEFRAAFAGFAASVLREEDFVPVQRVDAEVRFTDINNSFWRQLSRLEPFGMGNPTPVLMARGVEIVSEPEVMKEKHLKFSASQGGRVIKFKAFGFVERAAEVFRGALVDLTFQMEADDYWGGFCTKVCDVRPAS